ncbi:Murein L,D-transpeptidase YcbB/YkuD [Candidatus Electronema halotolerans]
MNFFPSVLSADAANFFPAAAGRYMFLFHSVLLKKAAHLLLCLVSSLMINPLGQLQPAGHFQAPPSLDKDLFWLLKNQPAVRFSVSSPKHSEAQDALLNDLYAYNGVQPYWVTEYGPKEKASVLIAFLTHADEDGLDPSRYHLHELAALLHVRDVEGLARLDIMLTLVLSAYLKDMHLGQAAPFPLSSAGKGKDKDIAQLTLQGLNSPDMAIFLAEQAPQHQEYQALKALLAKYRRLDFAGGWPKIPSGPTIRPGDADQRVDLLAKRLYLSGDLSALPLASAEGRRRGIYDKQLVKAVKHFQRRCGLEPDGAVGTKTQALLNRSVEEEIRTIRLNLDRWRGLPHQFSSHHLLVNIAGFDLTMLNNGQPELTMPVIVGKEDHKTPVFSHAMSYIEINPYWNIPPSIAQKEIVKKMQQDSSYLRKQRIRIFAGWNGNAPEISASAINWHRIGARIRKYRLRQEPGKGNALGTVKFMFPNRKNIYLHDTPGHSLFQRARRAFSHGCVRVSHPLDLAWQILNNDGQTISKEKLQKQIATGRQAVFVLRQPLPVHIVYLTVRVSEDGMAHFYEDIYGRDALLAKALFHDQERK